MATLARVLTMNSQHRQHREDRIENRIEDRIEALVAEWGEEAKRMRARASILRDDMRAWRQEETRLMEEAALLEGMAERLARLAAEEPTS